jgi:PAS domain S-box-containing protein
MITPIHNETSCSYTICHARPDQQRILGILDVGISLKEADLSVRSALQKTLLFAIGVFLGTSVILIGALAILVGNPIGKIVKATQRISHGEYGERIETRSRGELGELAQSFNLMSEQVEERARQLQRSREQFQTLFENVPSYIAVVDRSYRIVEANRNFRDVFGKWEGEHCFRAYKGLSSKCEYCPVELTFQDSQPHRSEEKGVTKSGDEIHYLVYTAPVFDDHGRVIYSIEMSVDLREKRRLAKALRVSLEYLNNLVENSIHGIVAADAGGHVMIYNRAAERLLGYTPAEVLGGTDLERLFPEHFAQNVQEVLQEKGEVGSIAESHEETWVWAKGGERIPIRFSGLLLMEDGLPVGAVGFFQDLRPLKAMEQEKQQAERLAVVGQTVAALAHGIKNIIQGLEGGVYVTQTAMKRREEPLLEKGWSMMQRNIEKISLLVKDLLSFSKVRVAEMESVQPNELAEEVRTLFQENAGLAGIDLVMELDPSAGHAWLDPKAVHTCLANLLSNAIDACTEDKEKEHHRVVVRTRKRDDGAITFEVEDDGIGMEEATRERLFTNFFSTKGTKGTGLGLMVTQKLVHEHGGRVSVVTEVGRGSLFRITIPQRESGASIQERCEILAQ